MGAFEDTLPLPSGSEPFSWPIARPPAGATPVLRRPPLTPEQQRKLANLTAHFNKPEFALPTTLKAYRARNAGSGRSITSFFIRSSVPAAPTDEAEPLVPLNDVEKCYWSTEAFQRCLRATKWDYDAALRRAESTVFWRREFNAEGLGAKEVSKEGETGKEIVAGYDKHMRPILYMHPYRQNTQTGPAQIDFVVWCLERAIDLMPPSDPPTEMLCLCIDFGANLKNVQSQPTSLGQARKVLEILQTYYCERLGRAICINVPGYFWAFYKLVGPFVDPMTKEKIRFLDKADARAFVEAEQLQKIFGGNINFQYNHDEYFPAMTKLCEERKAANLARWRKYGNGQCGLSETVIRGAAVPSDMPEATREGSAASTVVEDAELEKNDGAGAVSTPLTPKEFVDAPLAPVKQLEKARDIDDLENGVVAVQATA